MFQIIFKCQLNNAALFQEYSALIKTKLQTVLVHKIQHFFELDLIPTFSTKYVYGVPS